MIRGPACPPERCPPVPPARQSHSGGERAGRAGRQAGWGFKISGSDNVFTNEKPRTIR